LTKIVTKILASHPFKAQILTGVANFHLIPVLQGTSVCPFITSGHTSPPVLRWLSFRLSAYRP